MMSGMRGKKHSEETKRKIGEGNRKSKPRGHEPRSICLDCGREYGTIQMTKHVRDGRCNPEYAKRGDHKRIFLETYGSGPWECGVCTELIYKFGNRRRDGHIHHLNGNHYDNDPSNLQARHGECHLSKHQRGKVHWPEWNAKVGRKNSERTPQWRAKVIENRKIRVMCSECGRSIDRCWLRRHLESKCTIGFKRA